LYKKKDFTPEEKAILGKCREYYVCVATSGPFESRAHAQELIDKIDAILLKWQV
jgi:hypothetical protein